MPDTLPELISLARTWRSFETVPSGAEALSYSECCRFSLATLEVDADPETGSFALTEREGPGSWRWAIVSDRGQVLRDGWETTKEKAKKIANETLYVGFLVSLETPI